MAKTVQITEEELQRALKLRLEEKKEFLAAWETEARAGGVLSVHPIHAALVKPDRGTRHSFNSTIASVPAGWYRPPRK